VDRDIIGDQVMSATLADTNTQGLSEAVIISGPRKGEFITVPESEPEPSPAAEALLAALVADANRLAESAKEASAEARELLEVLRQVRRENRVGWTGSLN
jgi:hypothetical protein